jgi:hypothetical protein
MIILTPVHHEEVVSYFDIVLCVVARSWLPDAIADAQQKRLASAFIALSVG